MSATLLTACSQLYKVGDYSTDFVVEESHIRLGTWNAAGVAVRAEYYALTPELVAKLNEINASTSADDPQRIRQVAEACAF